MSGISRCAADTPSASCVSCRSYLLSLRESTHKIPQRPAEVRNQLQQSHMPSQESAPDDEDIRQTYNFAPGYHGLVYRAAVPDQGVGDQQQHNEDQAEEESQNATGRLTQEERGHSSQYKLQAMKWGEQSGRERSEMDGSKTPQALSPFGRNVIRVTAPR